MDSFATAAAALLFALFITKLCLLIHSMSNRKYPPTAGTIFHTLFNLHRFMEYQTGLSKKYKTFRILTPFGNYMYTVDPANVEYILKTNFANYRKGDLTYEVMNDLLGDGIFSVDGEKWRQQRKIASFEFSTKMLRDYSSVVFRRSAIGLAKIISELASSNQMMDIQDLLMKSGMDTIFKIGFGVELGVLAGLEESVAFSKAFDEASCQIVYRYVDIFWKVKKLLNIGSEARMKKNIALLDEFVYKVIRQRSKQWTEQRKESKDTQIEDILSRFLIEKEKPSSGIDDKYLRDIILNFLVAGKDTTAGTLSWFFYMMCKHPRIQDNIAREIRTTIKMQEGEVDIDGFGDYLTEDAVNGMQYLHAALTETLRLYPAVPVDVKCCCSDDTLPDGFRINKGDMINYQPYPMGRMKFLWGDDAEEFRPERWFNDDGVFVPESPFKFTAFQAGPRICLGKEFAYRQMKIVAATLLYFFRFELWDPKSEVRCRTMITLQIDGGLRIRAMHR